MTGWKRDESVEKIVEKFKNFNMYVDVETIRKTAQGLVTSQSEEAKEMFRDILKQFEIRIELLKLQVNKPFIEVPEFREGDISLGNYVQGEGTYHECKIRIDDLIQTVINATTGKSKTNTQFHFCTQIFKYSAPLPVENKVGFVAIDRRKDYRQLPLPIPVLDVKKDLFINLFEPPPGSDQIAWLNDISNTLMYLWDWGMASRNYFMKKVNDLFDRRGDVPTMLEVFQEMKTEHDSNYKQSRRETEIQEVNIDRIENILREFGQCMTTRRTFKFWEFIDNRIPLVIEADLSPDSYSILAAYLLQYAYRYHKDRDVRGNISGGGYIFIVDEAADLWEIQKDYSEARRTHGANFISLAPLRIRSMRLAIIAASQRPLSPDLMAAANLRMVGITADYKDMQYFANNLGDPDLIDVIPNLGIGRFLVRVGERKPALVAIPYVEPRKITDDELAGEMKEYREAIAEYCKDPEEKKERKKFSEIDDTTKLFLYDYRNYPDSQLKDRYSRLHLKDSNQQQALALVMKSGCIDLVKDNLHSIKQSKYIVATQKGIDFLRSELKDVSAIEFEGNMTPAHILYQTVLYSRLKNLGFSVAKEREIGKKKVDVYAEGTRKIAFEIAVSPDVDIVRVLSALDNLDEYYFLTQSSIVEQSIKQRIQGPKIRFRNVSEFLLSLLDEDSEFRSISNSNPSTPPSPHRQESSPISPEQPQNEEFD